VTRSLLGVALTLLAVLLCLVLAPLVALRRYRAIVAEGQCFACGRPANGYIRRQRRRGASGPLWYCWRHLGDAIERLK